MIHGIGQPPHKPILLPFVGRVGVDIDELDSEEPCGDSGEKGDKGTQRVAHHNVASALMPAAEADDGTGRAHTQAELFDEREVKHRQYGGFDFSLNNIGMLAHEQLAGFPPGSDRQAGHRFQPPADAPVDAAQYAPLVFVGSRRTARRLKAALSAYGRTDEKHVHIRCPAVMLR